MSVEALQPGIDHCAGCWKELTPDNTITLRHEQRDLRWFVCSDACAKKIIRGVHDDGWNTSRYREGIWWKPRKW